MPDLTASLDVTLARVAGALVVPRDAVATTGSRTYVKVQRGSSYEERDVTVGATSALHAVITSGVDAGAVVARNIAPSSEPVPADKSAAASAASSQPGQPGQPGQQ
jgi:hypothetical protein